MKLIVESEPNGARIAVVEDGRLLEVHAGKHEASRVGEVHLGRVRRLAPALDAAFVDIGLERNAFLHASDVHLGEGEELTVHQPIVVQIFRDPLPGKGARVRRGATLPGRLLVLLAPGSEVTISSRITDDEERQRLLAAMETVAGDGVGWIVRTAARGVATAALLEDAERLADLWRSITERAASHRPPTLLHADLHPVERWLRDRVDDHITEIWVEHPEAADRVRHWEREFGPGGASRVRLHTGPPPLFQHLDLERQVRAIFEPTIELPSGGSLVIEPTEALVAIDVNSGNRLQAATLEETALAINLEAATEAARQLRLRDLAGIIVIDFIDLREPEHWRQVIDRLEAELARDRAASQVEGPVAFGLVAITRKRGRRDLWRRLTVTCDRCRGTGRVRSPAESAAAAGRALRAAEADAPGRRWRLRLPAAAEEGVLAAELSALRDQFGDRLDIVQTADVKDGAYELEEASG